MGITQKYINEITYEIIGAAIEVHKAFGPVLLESAYEKFFLRELELRKLEFNSQRHIGVQYKGAYIDTQLRYDILVEDLVIVEIKAVEKVLPIHSLVLISYMELLKKPKGILLNFHCVNIFNEGQKTFVNKYFSALPDY